jgi:hypothetical protein
MAYQLAPKITLYFGRIISTLPAKRAYHSYGQAGSLQPAVEGRRIELTHSWIRLTQHTD